MASATTTRGDSFFRRVSALIGTWAERHCHWHHLGTLHERMLDDIGLTRAECDHEHRKPFWKD